MGDVSNLDEHETDEQDVVTAATHLDPERRAELAALAARLRAEQDA